MVRRFAVAAILASMILPQAASAQTPARERRAAADLAALVAGTYVGDVISDSRGSSRSGVTVQVVRIGPNLVEIRSDYARIPTVRIPLTTAMNAVLAASGDHVFLINRDQDPGRLDLTIDEASLSLQRQ